MTASVRIPRRITLLVDCPEMLSDRAINETVALAAARLKFLMGQTYRAQMTEVVEARRASRPYRRGHKP